MPIPRPLFSPIHLLAASMFLAASLIGCQPGTTHQSAKSPSPAADEPANPRAARAATRDLNHVGPLPDGGSVVPTSQLIHPAGDTIEFPGRPVDMALSPDASRLFVKDNRGLVIVDTAAWSITQTLKMPKKDDGGSMVGIAVSSDGSHVYLTTALGQLVEATIDANGQAKWGKQISLPGFDKGSSFPCGVALSPDNATAYVCLSRNNTLAIVDLASSKIIRSIPVGVAPYDVKLADDGTKAYVSNWGGRTPGKDEPTALSAGTLALIDARGVATSGTLSTIDLVRGSVLSEVEIGRSASAVLPLPNNRVCVTASNDDLLAIVSSNDLTRVSTRPDADLPFGSMPNGIARVPDDAPALARSLLITNAGNNAIAVFDGATPALRGLIPTAWYPGPVLATRTHIFVACINGVGSRTPKQGQSGWNSHWHRGTISRIPLPDSTTLAQYTAQAHAEAHLPQALLALDRRTDDAKAVPIPAKAGQKSLFEHVLYIIKENRTFDQVFGDMPKGNTDPSLCVFGREVTPNQHALAERFGLLDNFYCNGVLSADGHSWATEGISTPYLQRSFGGFKRSYTFGDDPLTYSSGGFVWDMVLANGYSYRNYGEFNESSIEPKGTFFDVFEDLKAGTRKYTFKASIGVDNVRKYSCPDSPGWNLAIPDQHRADVFLREFAAYEKSGNLPNFMTLYLPNDHTNGAGKDSPTPRAMVADNDLALGRIVDAITHSKYWATTCIFVVEDDPQNGFDHVDGHRSTCLVISPYSKRSQVVSDFYNQASVVHSIGRIFGAVAPNQIAAMAPVMSGCFNPTPDLEPFTHLANNIPLDERNPVKSSRLGEESLTLAQATEELDFTKPDRADEDTLNRIVWHSVRGPDAQYPAQWAGAHGRGLARLGLTLAAGDLKPIDDDDDDD